MNPDAALLWRAPRWALAVLLAMLGMLGPFAVDTYLPAFDGIAASTGATPTADAADAVGIPVRLRLHEPLSWRAGRQLRPPAGGAGRRCAVRAGVGRLRVERLDRRACLLAHVAGAVHRCRHRRLARGDPRHVSAGRRAARDVAGDHLLRRRAGRRADRRRLSVRAPRLALDLLVPRRHRRRAVGRQLEAAARDLARDAAPAVQRAEPAARLLATRREPEVHRARLCQRRAVQRHVPVRAVGADLARPAPRARRPPSSGSSSSPASPASWAALGCRGGWPDALRRGGRSGTASSSCSAFRWSTWRPI